jgi:hypothetical protein
MKDFKTRHGPPTSFKCSHFKSAFFPNFNNMIDRELVIVEFSTAKASSALQVQIRTLLGSLSLVGLGANDVRAERR